MTAYFTPHYAYIPSNPCVLANFYRVQFVQSLFNNWNIYIRIMVRVVGNENIVGQADAFLKYNRRNCCDFRHTPYFHIVFND